MAKEGEETSVKISSRAERQRILALSPRDQIESCWQTLGEVPSHQYLRQPETGMAMLRGRIGGTGRAFNFGEMTLTRASVRLADGTLGHGWVRGRDARHAELIALSDALSQLTQWQLALEENVIQPLGAALAQRRRQVAEKAAATRVDFFTMVRGE